LHLQCVLHSAVHGETVRSLAMCAKARLLAAGDDGGDVSAIDLSTVRAPPGKAGLLASEPEPLITNDCTQKQVA
jgi:hypothetical protein